MLANRNNLGHHHTVDSARLDDPGRNFRVIGDHPAIAHPDAGNSTDRD